MVKKKHITNHSFKNEKEMDEYLDKTDLGDIFKKSGKLKIPKTKKINLDLPEWLLLQLDFEANRAGVSRQPLIKMWLVEKLDEIREKRKVS
jgi:hypothetical protein